MVIFFRFIRQFFNLFSRFLNKYRLSGIFVFVFIFNIISGILFYFLEKDSQPGITILDSIWWAMVTMTTEGYGDITPKTVYGRFLVGYPSMLVGIGIIGYLVGTVAEIILKTTSKQRKGLMKIKENNHIIICGCPNIDKILILVDELRADPRYQSKNFVLIHEDIEIIPEEFVENNINFVRGDPTREEVLFKANILESQGVFVLADNPAEHRSDERTFTVGSIIDSIRSEHKLNFKIIVELVGSDNLWMMKKSNVDGILPLTGINDCLLVQEFLDPGAIDAIKEMVSNRVGSQIYVLTSKLTGYTIYDIRKIILESNMDIIILGVNRLGEILLNPQNGFRILENDKMIFVAKNIKEFQLVEHSVLNFG